jgi:hypothetical protein
LQPSGLGHSPQPTAHSHKCVVFASTTAGEANVKSLDTSIDIEAPPERVWTILMDFEAYPAWNPFITSIEGERRVGGKLSAQLSPPGGKPMTFKPTVQVFEEGTELTWLGRLFMPGIFDGRHTLRVEPRAGGSRFIHREQFTGITSGLLMRFIGEDTGRSFHLMNEALKERAEAG